jgi:hypothetical protein
MNTKNMNAADQAIEEIRTVRHRISSEHGHNVGEYLASLRLLENLHSKQLQEGEKLLAQRSAERARYPEAASQPAILRDRPKN